MPGQKVAQVDHALARVGGVAAVGIAADDVVEVVVALRRACEVALREVHARQAGEDSALAVEIDQRLQVVGVVDVAVARIGTDEAVDAGRRVLEFAGLVLGVGQFELRLFAIGAEGEAGDQALVILLGLRRAAFDQVTLGLRVQVLERQCLGFFLGAAEPAADGLAATQAQGEGHEKEYAQGDGETNHLAGFLWGLQGSS